MRRNLQQLLRKTSTLFRIDLRFSNDKHISTLAFCNSYDYCRQDKRQSLALGFTSSGLDSWCIVHRRNTCTNYGFAYDRQNL